MIAIILAAGRGSRLGNFTDDRPKSLLPLKEDTTLLDYNINVLNKLGVKKIFIITGYKNEMIEAKVAGHDNIECIFNPFWDTCNVLGSFYLSFPFIEDDFFFLHADTIVDYSAWEKLQSHKGEVILPYKQKICGEEEMKVSHDKNGRLKEINKTMLGEKADGEFLGIAKFSISMIEYLGKTSKALFKEKGLNLYMEEIISEAINTKINIQTFEIGESKFVEVDFSEDYELAIKRFGSEG
ncbi:MAG: phosphocholine cytidylyltransferase family protein [Balneola sp.]